MGETFSKKYCLEKFKTHIQSHVSITEKEFELIATHFVTEHFNPKGFLQTQGSLCKYEYFVVKGLLQHFYVDELGKEFTLSFPHENWWAGDFKSFKSENPTDKFLIALESTWVLKISRPDFFYLHQNSRVFEWYITLLSEKNSLRMQERVISDMSSILEHRFEAFFHQYPKLVTRLSQKKIASYLGVSQEHLSKVLNKRKDLPSIDLS